MEIPVRFLLSMVLAGMIAGCAPDPGADMAAVEQGLRGAVAEPGEADQGANILERMEQAHVPGISVAVIDGGKLAWTKGYGITEAGTDHPVDESTLFQVGSTGKTIAAVTTLALVEEGLLDLDEDLRRYLKSWRLPENRYSRGVKVTLRQLMSHTAGIGQDYSPPFRHGAAMPSLTEHLRSRNYELIKEPGGEYYYSGAGYVILEQIIEDVTGRPYKDVAAEKVLKPLGMDDTHMEIYLPDSLLARAALAHHRDGSLYADTYPIYPCFAPGTCDWSTAEDMAKLLVELMQSYAGKSNKVLTQARTREMLTNLSPAYGLGLKVIDDNGATFIGHSGDFYGFHACMYGYLEEGDGIVVLTNGDGGVKLYNEIIRSVAEAYDWPGSRQVELYGQTVSREQLARLTGTYLLPGLLDVLNVYWEDDVLTGDVLGYSGYRLQPVSPYSYYHAGADGFITFDTEAEGKTEQVEFRRIGVLLPGRRVPGLDLLHTVEYEKGVEQILAAREDYAQKAYFESIFNSIGYTLLNGQKTENAIAVFRLGVAIYPEASNLYDSLGEAYMKAGRDELAIVNYRKSLELDPTNTNAVEMLQRLER